MSNDFEQVCDIADEDFLYLSKLYERQTTSSSGRRAKHSDVVRRFYVRAFITLVESRVAAFKQHVLQQIKERPQHAQFSFGEQAVLAEKKYKLNRKGGVDELDAFQPFVESIPFAFRMLARSKQLTFSLDKSSHGWEAMQKAVKIRHRLTHPKTLADLAVSDEDLNTVRVAEIWFRNTHSELIKAECDKAQFEILRLKKALKSRAR